MVRCRKMVMLGFLRQPNLRRESIALNPTYGERSHYDATGDRPLPFHKQSLLQARSHYLLDWGMEVSIEFGGGSGEE